MSQLWKFSSEEFVFIRNLICLSINPENAILDPDVISRLDWQKIYRLLEQHRLWAAAELFLKTEYAKSVPLEYAEKIHTAYKSCCLNNLTLIGHLLSLGKLLDGARIPFVVVKGPLLSASIHGDINKRFSRDIDILVNDSDFPRVHKLLIANGFTPSQEEGYSPDLWVFWIRNKHLMYLNKDHFKVEIHTRLHQNPHVLRLNGVDPKTIFKEQEFFGRRFRVFQDDFLFLFLCAHGSAHFWFRLFWLVDICALMSSRSPQQLEDTVRLAGRFGCKRAVSSAFSFANYFSGNLRFEAISKDLCRFGNIYIQSWMDEWYLQKPSGTLYNRFRIKLAIHSSKFLFFQGVGIWITELVRILFVPNRKEFNAVRLPDFLQFLYFPLRPFLLLKKVLRG